MVGEKAINEEIMDIKWGSVVVCIGSYASHRYSALDFTLRRERSQCVM